MSLEFATQTAKRRSLNGYVQHVNKMSENNYYVSDWFGDSTVISFENGKEL